jgi:GR25 family glycosyltransferase involved in LPS biosynthesis
MTLWEKISKSTEEDITNVILEDDVKFDVLFEQRINFFISKLPNDWDVLYLGRKYLSGKIVNKYFVKGDKTDRKGYNVSSYGYVVRKRGCKKLLKIAYPLSNIEQDLTLRQNLDKYNAYFLREPIVFHEKFKSCINMNIDVYR